MFNMQHMAQVNIQHAAHGPGKYSMCSTWLRYLLNMQHVAQVTIQHAAHGPGKCLTCSKWLMQMFIIQINGRQPEMFKSK